MKSLKLSTLSVSYPVVYLTPEQYEVAGSMYLKIQIRDFYLFIKLMVCSFNPIWLGGCQFDPVIFFCDNSKNIGARKLKILAFLTKTFSHLRLEAWLLYLLTKSADILLECLIYPTPD